MHLLIAQTMNKCTNKTQISMTGCWMKGQLQSGATATSSIQNFSGCARLANAAFLIPPLSNSLSSLCASEKGGTHVATSKPL